jgi:RNA polymerase sigma factor (sigma-70 family)
MDATAASLWQTWRATGDERAFESLVRPHLGFAVDLARRSGCSAADAEDVLQEALVRLAREADDGPVAVGFRAWLGRVVSLRTRMLRRSEGRRRRRERGATARKSSSPEPSGDDGGLEAALALLPVAEREAVILHYLHDVEYAEMARILAISPAACRVRVHRGIERLRRRVGSGAPALVAALPLFAAPAKPSAFVHAALQKSAVGSYVLVGLGGFAVKKIVLVGVVAAAVGAVAYVGLRSADGTGDERAALPPPASPVPSGAPGGESDVASPALRATPPPRASESAAPARVASRREEVIARIYASGGLVGVPAPGRDGTPAVYYDMRPTAAAALEGPVVHVKGGPAGAGAWLADLDAFPELNLLVLQQHRETVDLAALPVLPRLTEIDLDHTAVTGVASLVHQDALSVLSLGHVRRDAETIRAVASLYGLRRLRLEDVRLDDAGLEALSALRRLEGLKIDEADVTDAGLAHLAQAHALQHLDLSKTRITGEGFRHLTRLGSLRKLTLEKTRVNDEGVRQAAALPALAEIDLEGTDVTDAGAAHLATSRTLEDVNLEKTRVTDAAFEALARIGTLRRLNVGDTSVTPEGLARFRAARPDVRVRD